MEKKQKKLNSKKKSVKTDNKQSKPWLFKKGQSGNPDGRPKDSFSLLTILKKQLQEIPKELKGKGRKRFAELLVKKQLHKAIVDGDVAMIRLIWNYVEGMPKEHKEVSGGLQLEIIDYVGKDKGSTSTETEEVQRGG